MWVPDAGASASIGSIPAASGTQAACAVTASATTSTIRVPSLRSVCTTSTASATSSTAPSSISRSRRREGSGSAIPFLWSTSSSSSTSTGRCYPPNRTVVVKTKLVSKIAEKKIKAAGGAVVRTAWSAHPGICINFLPPIYFSRFSPNYLLHCRSTS